eukprot:g25416.t3
MALGIFSAASNGLGLLLQMVSLLIGSSLVLAGSMTAQALATYLLYLDTAVDSALELGIDLQGTAQVRCLEMSFLTPCLSPILRGRSTRYLKRSPCIVPLGRPQHWWASAAQANRILKFDNADVRHLDRVWLRRQMGLVPQSPKLFRGTIAENIAWGQPCVTQAEVHAAAEAAMAAEFIAELPEGFDTICSDEKLLSGAGKVVREQEVPTDNDYCGARPAIGCCAERGSDCGHGWRPNLGTHFLLDPLFCPLAARPWEQARSAHVVSPCHRPLPAPAPGGLRKMLCGF